MKRDQFIELLKKANKAQLNVLKSGFAAEEYENAENIINETIRTIINNKDLFINEFGKDWFDSIIDDTNCMILEFVEKFC